MAGLTDLNLSHNQLAVLDDLLGIFAHLHSFDASHNAITHFEGDTLSRLTALRLLDLSHNLLQTVTPGIRSCSQLQQLRVTHNRLTAVPEYLTRTTKLMSIDLSHNQIADAAGKIFAMLNDLRILSLHHNHIGPLPALLFSMRHLERLDLSYNRIPDIAAGLGSLTSAVHLDFSHNSIVSLPDSISSLTSLRTLLLDHNCLTTLPSSLSKLYRSLKQVTVSHNNFTSSPSLLHTLPLLLHCNLSWNPDLQSQFVDYVKLSAEYKPKKAFITTQTLTRRVTAVVSKLDSIVSSNPPPPHYSTHFMTEAESVANNNVDTDVLDLQNSIQDDNTEATALNAMNSKERRKMRAKRAKRVKQALEWHDTLRQHIHQFSARHHSEDGSIRDALADADPSRYILFYIF